eukprot:GHVS01022562.1.p1 GENE.GHVS01022562.1~~GHVS01022562.1.p1  ORF type:complete len:467 (-),score=66.75 GHVS01022562.1:939-2339(-)
MFYLKYPRRVSSAEIGWIPTLSNLFRRFSQHTRPPSPSTPSSATPSSATCSPSSVHPPSHHLLYRGFGFDRLSECTSAPPQQQLQLEQLSLLSFSSFPLDQQMLHRFTTMLKYAGNKKHLEAAGKYMALKLAARTAVERPAVLPSRLIAESADRLSSAAAKELQLLQSLAAHRLSPLPTSDQHLTQLALAHAEDRRHKLHHISYSPDAALGVVAHNFPGLYASCLRVLLEVARRVPGWKPESVLEYGAGCAPAISAAHVVWEESLVDALAVEPSVHLSNIGQFLTSDWPHVRWQGAFYEDLRTYDLIVSSFHLADVLDQNSREMLIKRLWNKTSDGGLLVIMERGTPTGFRFIHHIRELFITELSLTNFHFVAPCPHEGYCPMATTGRDWLLHIYCTYLHLCCTYIYTYVACTHSMYTHSMYTHSMYTHSMYTHSMYTHSMYTHSMYTHSMYTHSMYTHSMYIACT